MAPDRDADRHERLLDGAGLVRAGLSPEAAGELVGLPPKLVEVYAHCSSRVGFVPTPAMIEARAAEIRSGWTDSERRNRFASRRQGQRGNGVDAPAIREFVPAGDGFRLVG